MTLQLTCSNGSSLLPEIPRYNNMTWDYVHPQYNAKGKALAQMISSALARSTFAKEEIDSLLKRLTSNEGQPTDASSIVGIKPIPSIIIYSSIALFLFIVLSIVLCSISCGSWRETGNSRYRKKKKRNCSSQRICMSIIFVIGLIVVGDMIYIAVQVNRTATSIDQSIKEINEEVYPKEISLYLEHLLEQMEILDQYSFKADSIVIQALRVIFVDEFNQTFREIYFFDTIRSAAIDSAAHIEELNDLINQEMGNSSSSVVDLFRRIQAKQNELVVDLNFPWQEVCNFANGTDNDIDDTIFQALDLIHQQLSKLMTSIRNDVLQSMIPWEDAALLQKSLEDTIRSTSRIVGAVVVVLIVLLGLFPIIFYLMLLLCQCRCSRRSSDARSENENTRSKARPLKSGGCLMRIVIGPMIIIVFVMVLLTGILYGIDLLVQGACRISHDDQPYLVSFLTDQLFGVNATDLIVTGSDVKTTFTQVIDDCNSQRHFTGRFFQNHLMDSNDDIKHAMTQLNDKVYDKFNTSIDNISITTGLTLLTQLSQLVNVSTIQNKIKEIETDWRLIKTQFDKITVAVPNITSNRVNQTIQLFRNYFDKVLDLTIDTCPLPLSSIHKTDKLLCHTFARSINGLWLSIFVYLLLIIGGLWIGGLCLYKRA